MNCVGLFFEQERRVPDKLAIWLPNGHQATFSELAAIGRRTEALMRRYGIGPGDTVLLFEPLGPRLYGCLIGLMAMGVGTALVEPWMPVEKIDHVLSFANPKAFLSNRVGQLWGLRVPNIRKIPVWLNTSDVDRGETGTWKKPVDVDPESPAILTFTSGTTGNPKGMVRTHRYLSDQHRVLTESLHADEHVGPDLCIFANFALANLASGKSSLIVPPGWKTKDLQAVDLLPSNLQPESLSCGPAFLLRLLDTAALRALRSIHIGGALTDCDILERGFRNWPDAHWVHLYGSTEVEPVAVCDAREAVRLSRERGFFQTLYLGKPVAAIEARLDPDTVWVTGPHVCPKYLANDEENRKYKHTDERGRVWHRMGDRIEATDEGWWYAGRENQLREDFEKEQRMYSLIGSSAAFVHRDGNDAVIYSQRAEERKAAIQSAFPDVKEVRNTTIRRDRRHRARIDRVASRKGGLWQKLLG